MDRESLAEIAEYCRDEESFDYLVDLTAVDWPKREKRFDVVLNLYSFQKNERLRLKAYVGVGETCPSVTGVWSTSNWLERECFDMFGIRFTGHPDLRRILMWEQYREGFPLRKDFPLRGRFSRSEQLKQALAANPEARYSMDELSIAQAFEDLPEDMRKRLSTGEKTGE